MSPGPAETGAERELRLDSLVAEFLRARDAGEHPDPAALTAANPDLADELRAFFRDLGLMDWTIASALSGTADHVPEFGPYRIECLIARGTSEVYEARDRGGRRVALKVLRSCPLIDAEERARFRREVAAVARLDHPNVVRLIDSGDESGVPYLAMPYIDGEDLSRAIRRLAHGRRGESSARPPVAPIVPGEDLRPIARTLLDEHSPGTHARAVAAVAAQAARGLAHAHDRGVLHRDVKPSNLILAVDGTVLLTDFGLAQTDEHPGITRTGDVVGTLRFLAPERFRRWADPRSDLYSLGLTLYELLTLRPAFPEQDRSRLIRSLVQDRPTPPRRVDPSVPRDLETIILKAIAPEPSDRYPSADDLADDLERFLDGRPILARRSNVVRRARRWTRTHKRESLAIATVSALILGSMLAVLVAEDRRRRDAEFQSTLLQIRGVRSGAHETGWRGTIWRLAAESSTGSDDLRLRDEIVASMSGLDTAVVHEEQSAGASSLTFDPSGQVVVLGGLEAMSGRDGRARVWDRRTGCTERFSCTGPGVVGFLDDGRPVELIATDARLELRDLRADRSLQDFPLPTREAPPATALGPGAALVAASSAGRVHVWDRRPGGKSSSFAGAATVLRFSPDGRLLGAGDAEGNITVWSLAEGREVIRFRQDRHEILSLAFALDVERHPDGARDWLLAAGTTGGVVFLYRESSPREVASFRGCDYGVGGVAFSPDGTVLAAAGLGRLLLWDLATGDRLLSPRATRGPAGLAFSPGGASLAAVTTRADGPAGFLVQDIEDGRGIRTLRGLASSITRIAFSPDEALIAALSQDWKIGIWDAQSGRMHMRISVTPGEIADNAAIAFSPDNGTIAFSAGESAERWDLSTGRRLRTWRLPGGLVDQLAFTANDRLLSFRAEYTDGAKSSRVGRLRDLLADDWSTPFGVTPPFFPRAYISACTPDGRLFVVDGDEKKTDPPSHWIIGLDGSSGAVVLTRPTDFHGHSSHLLIDPTGRLLRFAARSGEEGDPYRLGLRDLVTHSEQFADDDFVSGIGPLGDPQLRVDTSKSTAMGAVVGLTHRRGEFFVHFGVADPFSLYTPAFSRDGRTLAIGGADGQVLVVDLEEVRRRLGALGLDW